MDALDTLMTMMDDDSMSNNNTETASFCRPTMGGGMIMYMEGFKFTMANEEPCLNLFFANWTLNASAKFYAAMVGCFFLAIFVEGLSALRYRIVRSVKQAHRRGDQQQSSTQGLRLVVSVFHGLQGLVGYLLMLSVMTFSVELLLSVAVGLAVGYGLFFQYEEAFGRVHVTTNPCCSFLEGEARETLTQEEEDEQVVMMQSQPVAQQQQQQPSTGEAAEAVEETTPPEPTPETETV